MPIRVLVADDQAMVRGGFLMILGAEEDIEVVGEADDGERAVAEAERLRPDVVIMDIQMPNLDGVAATRRILEELDPAPRVLVVTTFDIDEYVY
jgi:DNA-binding NarL/FixJ family response regulator